MAGNKPDNLELIDSMDVFGDEKENAADAMVEVPLYKLSSDQLNCICC